MARVKTIFETKNSALERLANRDQGCAGRGQKRSSRPNADLHIYSPAL
jgi:hypothetical protein